MKRGSVVQAQAPGKKPVVSVGDEKLPVSFQSPGSLLLIRWVITQLFESLGLCCRDLCVHKFLRGSVYLCPPPRAAGMSFYLKGCRFVFTFNHYFFK